MDFVRHFLGVSVTLVVAFAIVCVRAFRPSPASLGTLFARARRWMERMDGLPDVRVMGTPALARVAVAYPTGAQVNGHPECQIELDVWPPNHPPYRASVRSVVHRIAVPRVQPGLTIPVKIDPMNPLNVILDV